MGAEQGIGQYRVGDWDFRPASGELRRRTDVRRLEPRAARTLELLCAAGGEVVTHDRLIAEVWAGRSLSENSVAVVIGQLRRALGDDAREPRLIETIPKRGYRLVDASDAFRGRRSTIRRVAAIVIVAALGLVAATSLTFPRSGRPEIAVTEVVNATGNRAYDPLARATSELMTTQLTERGFEVRQGSAGDRTLAGKLVMWDGLPYLGLTVTEADGAVRWSAMIKATPGSVPPGLSAKLDEFKDMMAAR